jgi:hypothetical protein
MKNRTGRAKDIQAGPRLGKVTLGFLHPNFGHSFAKNKEYEKIDKFSPGQLSNQKLVQFRVQSCNFWHPDLIAKLLGAALIHKT